MTAELTAPHPLLSAQEQCAIAEIEATTNVLKLVTRLTRMRFAAITKFTDREWVTCAVYDPFNLGIKAGVAFDLETTICSDFCITPEALFIPQISKSERYSVRPVVRQFDLESYAGIPIFLPDGRLYGALCVLDCDAVTFDDEDLRESLALFARLIGCVFFANLTQQAVAVEVSSLAEALTEPVKSAGQCSCPYNGR